VNGGCLPEALARWDGNIDYILQDRDSPEKCVVDKEVAQKVKKCFEDVVLQTLRVIAFYLHDLMSGTL
jgi:hypothetical protein